ncbi:MAG TPA: bifunctional diaminohydroxyphosphoribosylaminopyrimidine deaminase/5-amino-6-(5-phosphoribosylamino)uracil reductase RibD [Hanamia sp.]|nr:bifunctional diaminohydroxyphosphoribosylaminopyrimidine deaminase/5-amino-6-(5-phosphoribosylamino)uracil reductase RibD [Hanamia sp.]
MPTDEEYMHRCVQLAKLGAGDVAPNPMVGAVLVYEDKIIGEGYHRKFGEAHAEVNCINSVDEKNKSLIEKSTIYVSLEPCAHHGKTPPCADLIIAKKIKKVVIGCQDIYKEVAGKGVEKLQKAGVEVLSGVLENECHNLNKRFFIFHQKKRPYIILKWAQSVNGKIGSGNDERILISNRYSNRIVHKWRSEESAILVGTNTALNDNPSLTTRFWKGKNPVRIVIDKQLKLSSDLQVFDNQSTTIIFNCEKNFSKRNLRLIQLGDQNFLEQMIHSLYENDIQSVLVEGGRKTLQSFIDNGSWDEARVITNEEMIIEDGISAPEMKNFLFEKEKRYFADSIKIYKNSAGKF